MQNSHLGGPLSLARRSTLSRSVREVLTGTILTLATVAAANAAVIDDTVKKTLTTGAKAVSVGNPSNFDGDLRKIKPPIGWQPGDVVKVANPRHIRDVQTILPAVNKVVKGQDELVNKQLSVKKTKGQSRSAIIEVNIDGIGFTGVNPPDTTGDIGIKYYIQSINSADGSVFSVYDKTDGTKIAGPIAMASLAKGDCTTTMGDPVVLFDEQANRWLLTEFSTSATKKLCVLVSKTADPVEGGWHAYEFQAPVFPDYPKYSQMGGVYYVSANENASAVYALERSKMLNGEPAVMIRQEVPTLAGFGFNSITPIDVDGQKAAPDGTPGMFIRHRDDELHNSGSNNADKDFLEIWTLKPDFANVDNSKLEGPFNIGVSEFDSNFDCGNDFGCLEQRGTTQALDPLKEVVMYKGQYRHFEAHESIVGNYITKIGDNTAAIRWFELRRAGDSDWAVHDEGTYTEGDNNNRYMGAAAMDGDGNIALAYMLTGKDQYPSLAYNGRNAGDEAGTLTFGEQILIEGTGAIESSRDGDYSQMGVDPVDNCTMWFTAEYGRAGGQWGTRISSLKVPSCGDPNPGFTMSANNLTQEVCAVGEMQPINITASGYNSFANDITLSFVDLPTGISGSFSADTIKPGVPTMANISIAQGTAAGDYVLQVKGSSDGAIERLIRSKLKLMDKKPETNLLTPANDATKMSLLPTLNWSVDNRASSYLVEIATDENFTNIVAQSMISGGDSYRPSAPLAQETVYFWRVKASNSCGEQASGTGKFTTGSEKENATELHKGVASAAFTGDTQSLSDFYIEVPAGATDLTFSVSAIDGDADLYVTKDIRPQSGGAELCKSETSTSNESCTVEGDVEGTYFALVYGYAAYKNAKITATYTGGGDSTAPQITGQKELTVIEDNSLVIEPSDLTVNDPEYPTGYTVAMLAGDDYTVAGNVVKPNTDFSGAMLVKTKVSKGSLQSAEFELKIQVTGVNDAPVIAAINPITVEEDTGQQVQLSDLTVTDSDSSYPQEFTLTLAAGENYILEEGNIVQPAANFNGTLTVGVTVNDSHADSAPGSIQITVTPVNDEPVLVNDILTVNQDSSNNVINVLANDSDVDAADVLTLESIDYSGTGTATIVDGKISYSPKAGFNGAETFVYKAKDSGGAQKSASVTVTVKAAIPVKRASGGSMAGFIMLLLLPLVAIRRLYAAK